MKRKLCDSESDRESNRSSDFHCAEHFIDNYDIFECITFYFKYKDILCVSLTSKKIREYAKIMIHKLLKSEYDINISSPVFGPLEINISSPVFEPSEINIKLTEDIKKKIGVVLNTIEKKIMEENESLGKYITTYNIKNEYDKFETHIICRIIDFPQFLYMSLFVKYEALVIKRIPFIAYKPLLFYETTQE